MTIVCQTCSCLPLQLRIGSCNSRLAGSWLFCNENSWTPWGLKWRNRFERCHGWFPAWAVVVTYTTVFHFVEFVGSIRWLDLDHDEYYMQSIITNVNSTFHDLVGWDLLPETILNTSALPSDSEAQRCAMRISLHLLGKKRPAQTEMTRWRC